MILKLYISYRTDLDYVTRNSDKLSNFHLIVHEKSSISWDEHQVVEYLTDWDSV